MKQLAKTALGVLLLAAATFATTTPASAYVDVGVSFGFGGVGYGFGDPCDYYDYYDEAPPWGLPPDYCDYPVYFEPVFFDGYWYRGPIYYRWYHGRRLFWLHGGWHGDSWRGPRPAHINWRNHGGRNNGFRPGVGFRNRGHDWNGGVGDTHPWHDRGDRPRSGGVGDRPSWSGGGNNQPWTGGDHPSAGNGSGQGGFGGGHQGGGGGSHGGGHGGGHGPH